MVTNNNVGFTAEKSLYRKHTHSGSKNAVNEGGVTASYNMGKARNLGFNTGLRFDLLRERGSVVAANSLGDDNDEVSFSDLASRFDLFADGVVIVGELRNNDCGSTGCTSGVKSNVAGTSSHNLNNVTSCVRLTGVTKLINKLDNRIHSGVKADGVIGRGDIVINSGGNTDTRNALLGKPCRALEGAVTADTDNTLNAQLLAVLNTLSSHRRILELGATVGIKNCSALVYDIGYVSYLHRLDVALDKSRISAIYCHYLNTAGKRCTANGSDSRIHSGGVAA